MAEPAYRIDADDREIVVRLRRDVLRDAVPRLLERLRPVAETLGEAGALGGVERILERGNGAERIRRQLPRCADLPELVRWLSGEALVGVGLDRRSAQREACV